MEKRGATESVSLRRRGEDLIQSYESRIRDNRSSIRAFAGMTEDYLFPVTRSSTFAAEMKSLIERPSTSCVEYRTAHFE